MKAVDTNILVRLIAADDAVQTAVAERLVAENEIYISHTVLMETEWVLRSTYRFTRPRVSAALTNLLALKNVTIERPDDANWALARNAAGADLADMLHLTAARGTDAFATFDRNVARMAGKDAPVRLEVVK